MKYKNALHVVAYHLINQLFLAGAGFVVAAVIFIMYPAFFVYLVSAFFIFFGLVSIVFALKIQKATKEIEKFLK
ncbi:MAG: hypothetical protein NUV81_02905 [bacterium]|nr:hypothetical protein [bacterium]